jgi:hypothetical protein
MSKEGIIAKFIEDAVKESGWPEEKIEEITSYMVTYLNTGAKYGETPEGFLHWYIQDMGGQL